MEGTVKMQSAAAAKMSLPERPISAEAPKKTDDFAKLLQNKKEMTKQMQQAEDSKTPKAKTEEKAETVEESPEGEEKENEIFADEDSLSEEAIQQAALQQAAVQMTEFLPEALGESDVRALETITRDTDVSVNTQAEQVIVSEQGNETDEMISKSEEYVAVQAEGHTFEKQISVKEEEAPESGRQVRGNQTDSQIQEISGQDKRAQEESGTERQESQNSNMAGSNDRRVQEAADRDNTSQEAVYGIENFRVSGQTEHWTQSYKTEAIPLKTMPESLPEDLGKVLAAKMPANDRTLTVELEPASLGKLTIKLVYEGSRAAVSIMASNPKTLELLNQKASEIAAILEEKTGQETLIYTHQAEQDRDGFNENQNGRSAQEDREDRQKDKKNDREHSESFIQQLRLGLV